MTSVLAVGIDALGDPPGDLAAPGVAGEPDLAGSASGDDMFDQQNPLLRLLGRRRMTGERAGTPAIHLGRHDRCSVRDDRGEQRAVTPRRDHEPREEDDHPSGRLARSARVHQEGAHRAGKIR